MSLFKRVLQSVTAGLAFLIPGHDPEAKPTGEKPTDVRVAELPKQKPKDIAKPTEIKKETLPPLAEDIEKKNKEISDIIDEELRRFRIKSYNREFDSHLTPEKEILGGFYKRLDKQIKERPVKDDDEDILFRDNDNFYSELMAAKDHIGKAINEIEKDNYKGAYRQLAYSFYIIEKVTPLPRDIEMRAFLLNREPKPEVGSDEIADLQAIIAKKAGEKQAIIVSWAFGEDPDAIGNRMGGIANFMAINPVKALEKLVSYLPDKAREELKDCLKEFRNIDSVEKGEREEFVKLNIARLKKVPDLIWADLDNKIEELKDPELSEKYKKAKEAGWEPKEVGLINLGAKEMEIQFKKGKVVGR